MGKLLDDYLAKHDFSTPVVQPETTIGDRVKDIGITGLKGAIGLPETFVGLADIPTGGYVGKGLEKLGYKPKVAKDFLDQYYSDAQKKAFQDVHKGYAEQGFLGGLANQVVNDPSTILHGALESLPSALAAGGIARGVMKGLPILAELGEGGQAALASGIGEGAATAGQNLEQIRQESPTGLVTPKQIGTQLAAGAITGAIGAASSGIGNKFGIIDPEEAIAKGTLKPIGQRFVNEAGQEVPLPGLGKRVLGGGFKEGVLEELPQSWQEQIWQNVAQDKPWGEGAAEAAGSGMLSGGLMGAGFGALQRSPVITDTTNKADLASGSDVDAETKAALDREAALTAARESLQNSVGNSQGNLFGEPATPNSLESQGMFMPSAAPAQPVITSPTDPYFPNQPMQNVTSFNEVTKPVEEQSSIINPALDRIFDKAMRDEIKSLVKDPTNPAQIQAAIEKVYKKYSAIRDAQTFNVEGVSTPESQAKTTENKAKAHYITSVMEKSQEFNRAPSIQKNISSKPNLEEKIYTTVDDKKINLNTDQVQGELTLPYKNKGVLDEQPTEPVITPSGALAQPKAVPEKVAKRISKLTRTEPIHEVQGELNLVKDQNAETGATPSEETPVTDTTEELDTELFDLEDKEDAPAGIVTANLKGIPRRGSVASEFSEDTSNAERVHKEISPLLEKLTGGRASLSVVEGELYSTDKAGNQVRLEGETIDRLVHVVSNAKNPAGVARHETIHVLKNLSLFTKPEWNILTTKANKWIKDFNIAKDYPNLDREGQIEEAIARAYQNGVDKNTPLMKRIGEFFEALWNGLKSGTFKSANDILRAVEAGEVGTRPFSSSIASDGLSKPAIYDRELHDKHNKLVFGDLLDHFEDSIVGLGGNEVTERDSFDKFIDKFEPNFSKAVFKYDQKNNLLTGEYVDFARESGIINPIVQTNPRVFKAFQAYEKTLQAIVEDNSGKADTDALETPIVGLKDLNTVGELRKQYLDTMREVRNLNQAAESGNFKDYVNALDNLEDLGFGAYRIKDKETNKIKTYRYYDRVAAIKMFTWFHMGTSSEVALPEWHIFAEDGIRKNIDHYQKSYQKYLDMYYGVGDAMLELDKDTISNLVYKSQLVKDVRDNMSGKSAEVFVMRGYSPKDRNFVAMHVLRLLESFGLVSFNDMYGDILQRTKKSRPGEVISYEFSALKNVSSDFDKLDQSQSMVDYLSSQALLEEDQDESMLKNVSGHDEDSMAALIGRPIKSSTYAMAHKDDFKVHGNPEAVALLQDGAPSYKAAKAFFSKAGYAGLFNQVMQSYQSNQDGSKLVNNIIHLATRAMADVYNTTPNEVMKPHVIQAIETLTHSNVADVLLDETAEDQASRDEEITGDNVRKSIYLKQLGNVWDEDPYLKFKRESQQVRTLGDFEAPVPFSFGISHMCDILYKKARAYGDQDTRKEDLENLVLLASMHAAKPTVDGETGVKSYGFGILPPTLTKSYVIKKMLDLFKEDAVIINPIDSVTANITDEDRNVLRAIVTQELNITGNSKHTLYNKIMKIVEEDKDPAEVSVKDMPRYDKDQVRDNIQDLLVGFLDGKSSDYGAAAHLLTKYLKRFHNGLISAQVKDIDVVAMSTLSEFIKKGESYKIAESKARKSGETPASFMDTHDAHDLVGRLGDAINTILDTMADEYVPMFDVAKYTPKPAIDISKFFGDFASRSPRDQKLITQVYVPEIGNIVSNIIGEDIYTLVVSDRHDSDKIKVEFRMDSPAISYKKEGIRQYSDAQEKAAKARRDIFSNEGSSFTLIRSVAETMNKFSKSYIVHQFKAGERTATGLTATRDTEIHVPINTPEKTRYEGTKDERVIPKVQESHGVTRAEAGPEQRYVSINPERLYSGPFRNIQDELEARAKYLEKKLNGLIEEIIQKHSIGKNYVLPFVENFMDYVGYVYNPSTNSHIEKEYKDASITDPQLFAVDPVVDKMNIPFDVYNNMISQINSDMEQFVYGRPDLSTSKYIKGVAVKGKAVKSPESMRTTPKPAPIDNIWQDKDGNLFKTEMSLQGLAGKQSIRYYPFNAGARRNIRIMSVKAFTENFKPVLYDESQYNKDTFKESTTGLPVHSDLRNIELTSEFRTALADISKPIAQKIESAFFEATGIYNALKKSKDKFAELTDKSTKEPSMDLLVKALNEQSFSAEKIALWILKDEGSSKALKEYPAVVVEVNKALTALQDAGFLDPSISSTGEKLKSGSVSASGRKFLLTKKLRGMIEDAHTRRKLQTTQAAVWTEAVKPFVEQDGTLKATKEIFRNLKKMSPIGTSEMKLFGVLKNIFRVPYFIAEQIYQKYGIKSALDMMMTSNRREYIRDGHKAQAGAAFVKFRQYFNELPEANFKNVDNFVTYLDAKQTKMSQEEASKMFGVTKEEYNKVREFSKQNKEVMNEYMKHGGAISYMTKFETLFKLDGLVALIEKEVGSKFGTLDTKEAKALAKELMPKEITDKKWQRRFIASVAGYNEYLGDVKTNFAKTEFWMPRMREIKKFLVTGKTEDNKKIAHAYFDTVAEATEYANKLKAKDKSVWGFKDIPESEIETQVQPTPNNQYGLFSTMDSKQEYSNMLDAFNAEESHKFNTPWFGNSALEEGEVGSGHLYARRNEDLILGYNTGNFVENYTHALERIAMSFARMEYGQTQLGNLERMRQEGKNIPKMQNHIDEFTKHLIYDLKRPNDMEKLGGDIKRLTAFYYMGFSFLGGFVNSLQPFTVGAPELAKEQGKGLHNAIKDLAKWTHFAGKHYLNHIREINNMGKKPLWIEQALSKTLQPFAKGDKFDTELPENYKKALDTYSRSGLMNSMINDMVFNNDLEDGYSGESKYRKFVEQSLAIFKITEIINREGSFLAAYDHAYKTAPEGVDKDTYAYEKAERFVAGTQYVVNKFNTPLTFKDMPSGVGTAIYALMSYPFNMMNQMYKHSYNVVANKDYDSLKVLGSILLMTFAVGGSDGLPFADMLEFMWKMLGKNIPGMTGDFKTDSKRMLNTLGTPEKMQEFLQGGIPTLVGVNISKNIGMQTPFLTALSGDKTPVESVSGAAGGVIKRGYDVMSNLGKHQYQQAFESLTPEFVSRVSRAQRLYTEGQVSAGGRHITHEGGKVKETGIEAMLAAVGIKSSRWADIQEERQSQRSLKEKLSRMREIARRAALLDGDYSQMQKYNQFITTRGLAGLAQPLKNIKDVPNKKQTGYEIAERNREI